jgi:hypothetical protein
MMSTAVWTVFAVAAMVGLFAGCVLVVVVGVRMLENVLEKRRQKRTA